MNKVLRICRDVAAVGFCTGFGLYAFTIVGFHAVAYFQTRNNVIKSTELEAAVETEKKKLGLSNLEIVASLDNTLNTFAETSCPEYPEKKYRMKIRPEVLSLVAIRHELYHIAKDDFKYQKPIITFSFGRKEYCLTFEDLLLKEPRANLYAVTGIRF